MTGLKLDGPAKSTFIFCSLIISISWILSGCGSAAGGTNTTAAGLTAATAADPANSSTAGQTATSADGQTAASARRQTTGLVAYWRLDEAAGATSFADSAGSDTGSCSGTTCPLMGVAGEVGTAVDFVGGTQAIAIGSPSNLNFGTGSFSYSVWVYVPSSIGAYDMPWWKGGGSAPSQGFDMELGTGAWGANISDGSQVIYGDLGTETDNQWIFLAAVVDRASGTFKTYRNGAPVASASLGNFGSTSNSNPGYIGGLGGNGFNGKVDEVRIYNRALTDADVASLYSGPSNPSIAVSISPASVSLPTGGQQQFSASVSGATNTAVTWSATGGTISTSGLYTASGSGGTYTVTATSAALTSTSANAQVTVTQGNNWYVSPSGADISSCGSSSSPCATISYVSANKVAPGDTVHVNGSFYLNGSTCINTAASGTSSKPITYMGDPYGSAKINGEGACFYMWNNTGDYVNIYGFDFTGVQTNANTNSGTSVILSGGANDSLAYNVIHDLSSGMGAAVNMSPWSGGQYSGAPCSVHDNVFYNIGYNGGLHLGDYAMYIACGTNSYVYNNLIYNEGSIGIHCWHAANDVHIWNNTISNAQYIGILIGTGDQGVVSGAYFDVTNNIIVNSQYGIVAEDASPGYISKSSIFRNNLIYNNSVDWYYNNNGTDQTLQSAGMSVTGTVVGNPLFVSPSAGNYQLGSGSPAIGKGINVGLTSDLAGNALPLSTGVNIGAY